MVYWEELITCLDWRKSKSEVGKALNFYNAACLQNAVEVAVE